MQEQKNKIILKVGNIFTDISGTLSANHINDMQKLMSFRPAGYQFSPLFNRWIYNNNKKVRRMWDGWKRLFWKNKNRTYFPTGLLSLAIDYLRQNNIQYQFESNRIKPVPNLQISFTEDIKLRNYQQDCITQACKIGRGIIQLPTGSGKTIIAAGIISELKVAPFLFFVTSIDLLIQAKEQLEKLLRINGQPAKIGQIGGGEVKFADINVITVQTAVRALGKSWNKKYKFDNEDTDDNTDINKFKQEIKNLIHSAKGVICDEVQHWRADTCVLVCRSLYDAYYTFGCSATPWRDEGDDLVIQSCFGRKIVEVSASTLIKQGYLIKPSIKIIHILQKRSKYATWAKIYQDRVIDNKPYNLLIAHIANEFIKNNRLVLILVQRINHGKTLEKLIKGSKFVSGSSSKEERNNAINQLRNKIIKCLISTTIFDEGIDVRPLDTVILTGQGKSKVRAMQRIGRIMRPYTDEKTGKVKTIATAIDFSLDNEKYLSQHARQREKMYKSEEEYDIEHITVDLTNYEITTNNLF